MMGIENTMDITEIVLKLLLAVALGGLIGLEREISHKPAGFRTNILICTGSAMVMILSGLVLQEGGVGVGDLSRIAAAVITGIGFIGAGSIIQAQGIVVGLTTAATLWAVAGLGLVIGAGYHMIALIYAGIIMLTLIILRLFEGRFLSKPHYQFEIKTPLPGQVSMEVKKLALHHGIRFKKIRHTKEGDLSLIFFSFVASEEIEQKFHRNLMDVKDITEITIE